MIRRGLTLLPSLLGAMTVVFLIIHLIPGDPVAMIMRDYYTNESAAALRHVLGLDRPLVVQYIDYIWKILHLDFGFSFQNKREVIVNIANQLPYTVELGFASIVVALLIAIPAGILSAVYRNRWPDYVSRVLASVAISSPEFLLGVLLLLAFALSLGWFQSGAWSLFGRSMRIGSYAASNGANTATKTKPSTRTTPTNDRRERRTTLNDFAQTLLPAATALMCIEFAGPLERTPDPHTRSRRWR